MIRDTFYEYLQGHFNDVILCSAPPDAAVFPEAFMSIPLNHNTPLPLYKQLAAYLRQRIELGELEPGTKLPSIRHMARSQGINRITVETAYAELEADGLVTSRRGSGTFVLPPFPGHDGPQADTPGRWPAWQHAAAERFEAIWPGHPAPLHSGATPAGVISLADGNSDPLLFPFEAFSRTLREVMRRDGTAALEYEEAAGYRPLRRTIARILVDQGIGVTPDNIVVTSGSQQAIFIIAQVLLRKGQTVYTETPTYPESLRLFRTMGMRIAAIPMDSGGMRTDLLEQAMRTHGEGLILTMPTFHNPTGICMDGHRRRILASMAEAHGIAVVEDDYAGDIRYEGHSQPAIKSLSAAGNCLYIGTFSKMLVPGLRVGYIVAEGPVLTQLERYKRMLDLSSPGLVQRVLERFVDVGSYRNHLNRLCRTYRMRRDIMLDCAQKWLPRCVHITPPSGGLFAWLRLPEDVHADALAETAPHHGVAIASGTAFFPQPQEGARHIRINFCRHDENTLKEAMRRLGTAMQKSIAATKYMK